MIYNCLFEKRNREKHLILTYLQKAAANFLLFYSKMRILISYYYMIVLKNYFFLMNVVVVMSPIFPTSVVSCYVLESCAVYSALVSWFCCCCCCCCCWQEIKNMLLISMMISMIMILIQAFSVLMAYCQKNWLYSFVCLFVCFFVCCDLSMSTNKSSWNNLLFSLCSRYHPI